MSTESKTTEPPALLRSEAIPVARYCELTRYQRIGLRQLLRRLNTALTDLDNRLEIPTRPAWLSNDRLAQLAFIDGQRGTGKTTLMVTLVRLIVSDPNSDFYQNFTRNDGTAGAENSEQQIPLEEDFYQLAQPLRDRVIVLEPLDMEPLPRSTPLLAAILARLSSAAREFDPGRNEFRGLLDPTLDDNHDFIRFQQFQAKIARALDSNLSKRSGSLDREQYGQAVMEQEQDRLQIRQTLDDVLSQLTKAMGGSQGNPQRCMFLVPVDDVDMNPKRCLELLRLLRIYSPPQLYFLLMGQFDLVRNIVNMSMANEYEQVRPLKVESRTASDELLERKILEVAAANLQKMVPDVIELPQLSIQEIMTFRPTGMRTDNHRDNRPPSLGDLFQRIKLTNSAVLPLDIDNLYDLLMLHRDPTVTRNQNTSDFQIGTYPGLGAFQVTLRKLVDLYRDLSEALLEEQLYREAPDRQSNLFEEDLVLRVFDRYWKRIVSEDPLLDSESRERLQREGIDACEVVPGSEDLVYNHYSIDGALVKISDSSLEEEVTYEPLLSIADLNQNDGLPRLLISRRYMDHVDAPLVTEEILDSRTRCAYVLLHDLRVARSAREQEELLTGVNITSPVTMLWRSESGKTVSIPWPIPRLPSFAKVTALFYEISNELKVLKSRLTTTGGSNQPTHERTGTLKRFQLIQQHLLEELLRSWVINGQNAIHSISPDDIGRQSRWGDIVAWLERNAASDSALQYDWYMQIVMLTLPETCALDLIVKPRHLDNIQEFRQRDSVERLLKFSLEHVQELKGRRSQQFDTLWTDEFRDLWVCLNDKFSDQSWINLKLRQPTQRTRNDFRVALDEFGENFSEDLENKISSEITTNISDKFRADLTSELEGTEGRLAFEIELNSIRSLLQQGRSLLGINSQSACIQLTTVFNQAENLYSRRSDDLKVANLLIDTAEMLGIAYIELLSPRRSFEQYMRADKIISELVKAGEDTQKLKQRQIGLIISRSYPLMYPIEEYRYQEAIELAIEECIEELSTHPQDVRWKHLCADAQIILGLILRDSGAFEDAREALQSAINLIESSEDAAAGAGEFSREWASFYLASVLMRKGDLKSARDIADKERDDARIKSSRSVEDSDVQQLYLETTRLLGQILLYQGEISDAVDLFLEAENSADRYHYRNPTSLLRTRLLARTRLELAQALRQSGVQNDSTSPIIEALNLLRLALPELERIDLIDQQAAQAAYDLGTGYLELARNFEIMEEGEKVAENLEKADNAFKRALEVVPDKAPVFLKQAEVHWQAYQITKSTKQKREHRAIVEKSLRSASSSDCYFYAEIQEIERELSKRSRKSSRTKKKK